MSLAPGPLADKWLAWGSRDRTKGAPTTGSTTLRHQVSGSNTSCPGRGRLIFALRCLSSGTSYPILGSFLWQPKGFLDSPSGKEAAWQYRRQETPV